MTNFQTYYNLKFQEDINLFFSTIPEKSKFHEDILNKQIFSIQHERLTPNKNNLDFLDKENKEYFAVALFFKVLTDMVCYTHYKNDYDKFKNLTRYPKLIGNCLSWCHYHLHPKEIFNAMNQGKNVTEEYLLFSDKFWEAIEPMQEETINFILQYLPEINETEFWTKCKIEFPYRE